MKLYIVEHQGMVGGAVLRRLEALREAGGDLTLITDHPGLASSLSPLSPEET